MTMLRFTAFTVNLHGIKTFNKEIGPSIFCVKQVNIYIRLKKDLPASSSRVLFVALGKGWLWAVFWWARNGARLWNRSPQVLHLYSLAAARFSWTCFSWRSRFDLRWNVLSHLEHWCFFSLKWICLCCFKLSGRLKTFLQVGHSYWGILAGDLSTSSYKMRVNHILTTLTRGRKSSTYTYLCLSFPACSTLYLV